MAKHNHSSLETAAGLFTGWGDKSADGWVTAATKGKGDTWITGYSGNDEYHNNICPTISGYAWIRTA